MNLSFIKMEGCGNDYVYVDCVKEQPDIPDKSDLAVRISDRHFGVGSDGLIFVNRSEIADFEMEMYNADGSRGEMCGNGIRCVAKLVRDRDYITKDSFTIESMGKIKNITVHRENGEVVTVSVDMGEPVLIPEEIPANLPARMETAVNVPIQTDKVRAEFTGVSMGNPHAVIFTDSIKDYSGSVKDLPLESIGPDFENHRFFPARVNTEFVEVIDKSEVNMRVWERGSGETFACGTGCCATVVAGVLTGRTQRDITVNLRGGALKVSWNEFDGHVYMTGPARRVFEGVFRA